MCGIIGFIPKNNKYTDGGKHIIEQYQRQLHRGQKGFGHIAVHSNKVIVSRATEPVKAILDTYMSHAPIHFFHHRQPTSTENELEQTHPIHVSHDELVYDYLVIHNGVIRNSESLMKVHTEELGYVYTTLTKSKYSGLDKFNDSEALAIEAARYFDGKDTEIKTVGSVAIIVIALDKKTHAPIKVIWSNNGGNPIEMVQTKEGLLIASEIFHEDAEIVPENTFETIDLQHYFKQKKPIKNIIKLITAAEAKYKIEPPIVSHYPTSYPSTTHNVGYNLQYQIPQTTTTKAITNAEMIEEEIVMSPRETAFYKMAERIIEDISESIFSFFEDLTYRDVSEDEIMNVANDLNELLIEKTEIAKSKVRPHYDKKEEEEISSLIDFNYQYDINEKDEDKAFTDIPRGKTISQLNEESIQRYNDIMS